MREVESTTAPLSLLDAFGLELIRLQVDHGDVVVLRMPADATTSVINDTATRLRNALYGQGKDGVLVLVLAPQTDLTVLDEDAMAESGWVRGKSAARRLFPRQEKEA
jgi:pyruvate/oxaloacetate carboxyltransferase